MSHNQLSYLDGTGLLQPEVVQSCDDLLDHSYGYLYELDVLLRR